MTACDFDCPLCAQDGGVVLWRGPRLRVIEVEDADYPGFTRVVWNAHHAEMTDLSLSERDLMMRTVYIVEQIQREVFHPDKVNLASLGNMVPHLHWHVIPRWRGDRHFPDAVWAAPRIVPGTEPPEWRARLDRVRAVLPQYREQLIRALSATPTD
ncbi:MULTISPECIES: HIT family protein [unclassified Bordetella]|uniref:HIT family protein n=1 Tax=unclassified Bordetella TaxID=2630031 RepID=UPI0013291041|nr:MULTISPECIES: HIT family protein [unclassified Bordetella]MVW71416.1 HIT domain-containing protein [Bordetella sp. 15P40C-2]MVW79366.1 HIT domain-containing protein [Bordetella sp. 02P26C-1]